MPRPNHLAFFVWRIMVSGFQISAKRRWLIKVVPLPLSYSSRMILRLIGFRISTSLILSDVLYTSSFSFSSEASKLIDICCL